MDSVILAMLERFGPTGAVMGLGIYALRALGPLLPAAVGHLARMADAVQKLTLQLEAQGHQIAEIRQQIAEVAEDQAGLYALQVGDRPSRRRTPKPTSAPATGD